MTDPLADAVARVRAKFANETNGKVTVHHLRVGDLRLILDALDRAIPEAVREACAKVAEEYPAEILTFWDRPGGPPGNGYRPTNGKDIAAAIRAMELPGARPAMEDGR